MDTLAIRLNGLGRRDEALEVAVEAVANHRQLAETNPAAYLPDLATSLSNLANRFSDVDRPNEALEAAAEAVTHHRQLAEANPAAYLTDLARSLQQPRRLP